MLSLDVRPLRDDLSFGTRVRGITRDSVEDGATGDQVLEATTV